MSETRTAAPGAPGELKAALLGFVDELKGFRQDIQTKLDAQDHRMTMLDRKTAFRPRSPLATEPAGEAPERKAFHAYLRRGDDAALRGPEIEGKAMTAAALPGVEAAPQLAETVQSALSGSVSLRALCNVVQVESSAYEVLVDRDDLGTGWAGETEAVETDSPGMEKITIRLHELSAMPKASQRLLDDAAFDIEAWLAERIADKFARAEAHALLNGDGFDKPVGLLQAEVDVTGAGEIHRLGEFATGVSGGFAAANPTEVLIDMVYALDSRHRVNAHFVMNSKTASVMRKLKDADGRFVWADSLSAGLPARLLGHPVVLAEEMPDIAPDARAILFGDFKAAYTIAERPDLRILRDPFSAKPNVLFYATKRIGGGLVDGRAMKVLKFGA
ncbi:phage major capsid protein, HK97 family [Paracoccus isoporae]|uniref:Phage major capsid protein, HK97 family n=1 Tax=Paracoccus isoporae TaxID=591205 RepID=A0A1G7EWD3_9RHOB|nr:phage major capsid protein [Paracoccus isoporae]SDE67941.1 phage major capsid protein, HK97 family [Paracoccus isoporae]